MMNSPPSEGEGYTPKNFTLQGSNDDSNWETVDTRTGITWFVAYDQEWKEFVVNTPGNYRYYKLNVTSNGGAGVVILGQLSLYTDPISLITVSPMFTFF